MAAWLGFFGFKHASKPGGVVLSQRQGGLQLSQVWEVRHALGCCVGGPWYSVDPFPRTQGGSVSHTGLVTGFGASVS